MNHDKSIPNLKPNPNSDLSVILIQNPNQNLRLKIFFLVPTTKHFTKETHTQIHTHTLYYYYLSEQSAAAAPIHASLTHLIMKYLFWTRRFVKRRYLVPPPDSLATLFCIFVSFNPPAASGGLSLTHAASILVEHVAVVGHTLELWWALLPYSINSTGLSPGDNLTGAMCLIFFFFLQLFCA